MNKEEIKKGFETQVSELKNILNLGHLSTVLDRHDYDELFVKLVSHLYKGGDVNKITGVLSTELIVTYGLSPSDKDTELLVNEIFDWWDSKDNIYN